MKKRFLAFALSLALVFQCMLVLPVNSYAAYITDNVGSQYEVNDLFEYEPLEGNTFAYTITKYKRASDSNITQVSIPKKIDGIKVVEIANEAFKNARYLQQIYIPDSITKIGKNSFYQATALKKITIPGSVVTVGEKAFYKCVGLEEVIILYGVQSLGDAAFAFCVNLKTISAGETVDTSDNQTFNGNRSLTIHANENSPLRDYADSKITKAPLPDDSPAAYEYSVDENGEITITHYKSDRKNPIIPDNINGNPVSHLGEGSFEGTGIDSVKLPDTLKTIASNVFIGTNLEEITIPSGVTALGDNFIEDKKGLVIKGDSKVVEDYVSGTKNIVFEPYGSGTSSYYKLDVKITGYGSVTGTKGGYVKSGREIEVSAVPSSGYKFKDWSLQGDGKIEDINSPITTFTMPSANTKLIANFVVQPKPRLVIINGIVTEFNAYDDLVKQDYEKYKDKTVTGIAVNAFDPYYGHGNPSGLEIPSSLIDIPVESLRYCSNLRFIDVETGNLAYKDIDGVLFSADGKTLIKYPAKKDLTEYTVPEGVTTIETGAFRNCSKLTKVVLPNSVTTINPEAFYNCYNLAQINIPEGITSIQNYTFYDCYNLHSIQLPTSLTAIDAGAFYYSGLRSIDIPDSVITIGASAFAYCNGLVQVDIKPNISSIGDGAFYNCSSLQSINVNQNNTNYSDDNGVLYQTKDTISLVTYPMANTNPVYTIRKDTASIENNAFYGCKNLTQIVLDSPVLNSIGSHAFFDCSNIVDITIPESVASIGSQAFYSCDKLENINVNASNTNYTSNDEGILFNYNKDKLIVYPMAKAQPSYTIPQSVYTIDSYAFANSKALVNIDIANDVSSIGYRAFEGCSSLEAIEFPEKVTTISDYVVSGCSSLKKITIYNKNASISYNYSFSGIDRTKVIMRGYLDSTAETYAFLSGMKFEQIDKASEGLLVDNKGILYGYEGTDLDVILSSDIKQIGHDAFKNPNDIANETYKQIKTIKFPLSVRAFEPYAFDGCDSITSLDVTRAVYDIQKSAFNGCSNLAEINIDSSNTTYNSIGGKDGKGNGVIINHAGTIIKEVANAFKGPEGDGKYTIPSDITGIESSAFLGCSLTELTMGNVVKIDTGAFRGAFKDGAIKINLSNVNDIDNEAFADCTAISEVTLPSSLERLGDNVFDGCTNLKNIYVEDENKKYLDDAGVLYVRSKLPEGYENSSTTNPVELLVYPTGRIENTYTILKDTVGIYDNAFNGAKNIKSMDIPESVFYIGERAFNDCSALETLNLKNGLNKIEAYAFASNELLPEVVIPKTVQNLATGAFTNCARLYKATIYNDNLHFGTEGKIFDEEINESGDKQVTIYANEGSTAQRYVQGRDIDFKVLDANKVKETINLNATGTVDATVTLTPSQAESVMKNVYSNSANEIELNIGTVSSNVYSITASLPRTFIESFNSVANSSANSNTQFALTINTSIANVSLDKKAIAEIANGSYADDVEIVIQNIELSDLNISSEDAQKIGNRPIVELNIISGSNISNLGDGLATISIPYSGISSEISNLHVVSILNALTSRQLSNPDSTNTYLVFSTNNLVCIYAISQID